MKQSRNPLINEVDEWLVVETPPGDAGFRNRFVKTNLRILIQGPFLFLDSDVFVRGDLSEIFSLDTDIAGARNHSRVPFSEQVWDEDAATLQAMGWKVDNVVYINGGVMFYNDTPGARLFGAEFHRRWMASFLERKNYRDQPALNSALHDTKPKLVVLEDRFNAQIKRNISVVRAANIWHYYSSVGDTPHTSFELLVNELVQGARLDEKIIARILKSKHPWRNNTKVDNWAADRIMQRGQFDGWEAAWLRREFKPYILRKVHKALNRMK
jgi:lipopolysaccharide biosynthesis glycosyltransferase